MNSKMSAESSHQSDVTPLRDMIDLDCSKIFRAIHDELIDEMDRSMKEELGTSFIFDSFEEICRSYSFMSYKNDKLLVKEAVYILMKLNNDLIFSLDVI